MKREANFNYGAHELSIHVTDDQLKLVVKQESIAQGRSEDEVFAEVKQRRDRVYNATASVQNDRW